MAAIPAKFDHDGCCANFATESRARASHCSTCCNGDRDDCDRSTQTHSVGDGRKANIEPADDGVNVGKTADSGAGQRRVSSGHK
jgi:hypothetical protein